jgi:beta-glucosidase
MQHVDLTVSPGTDADRRALETERQMTDEERSGLISSLMVVVFGGSREPRVPARRAADRPMGAGLPRLGVPALLISDGGLG